MYIINRFMLKIVFISSILFTSALSFADVVVIANKNIPVDSLTEKEVRSLYLGKEIYVGGVAVKLYDHEGDTDIKKAFYKAVTRKDLDSVYAHWSRLIFSGKATPPQPVNRKNLLDTIKNESNAIGYIDHKQADDDIKVLFIIKS